MKLETKEDAFSEYLIDAMIWVGCQFEWSRPGQAVHSWAKPPSGKGAELAQTFCH
jgi:hypothetical protein